MTCRTTTLISNRARTSRTERPTARSSRSNTRARWIVYALAGLLTSCAANERDAPGDRALQGGAEFLPFRAEVGDTVGAFRLTDVAFAHAIDSIPVGRATFAGTAVLSGAYRSHPDLAEMPCLFVDDSSSAQLPRIMTDERIPWFCFANAEEAIDALGPPEGRHISVVVEGYEYIYERSDVNNASRFVRIVDTGDPHP